MIRSDIFSAAVVTLYLVIYVALLQFGDREFYGFCMLLFSPLLVCRMVYTILKFGRYKGSDLGDGEFGYQDRNKDGLGIF